MDVSISINDVAKSSFKMAHAWDKDQGLVTRLQFDYKTEPLRDARILNILRQGGPVAVEIRGLQALMDFHFESPEDEAKGRVKMIGGRGAEWKPREGFIVRDVTGTFDELAASPNPAGLAITFSEWGDGPVLGSEFHGDTPTHVAIQACHALALVPPDLEEPNDVIRCLYEAYTVTPGLRELQLILEMGTFDITEAMNAETGSNGPKEGGLSPEGQKPKRKRRTKAQIEAANAADVAAYAELHRGDAVTPGGEPVDPKTGEIDPESAADKDEIDLY